VQSVPVARHTVRNDLMRQSLPEDVIDNALIVVTELVANAVLHARPLPTPDDGDVIVVNWSLDGSTVVVDVTDGGGFDQPQVRRTPLGDTAGRGLAIVEAIADSWTVRSEGDRVTVRALVGSGALG
jgi:anti-sigma regulatory factor (Ser/Thr protein kinase)